jgi:hypothetical protein
VTTGANYSRQGRGCLPRQHLNQGTSRRHRGFKKNGPQALGRSRGGLTTKIHLVAANERTALCFRLSAGQAGDGPEGRQRLTGWSIRKPPGLRAMAMDRAYEGDAFDPRASLRAIRSGACCNKDSDRVTLRIHGQMYLGVEPPFVMSMAWLPPWAPAACPARARRCVEPENGVDEFSVVVGDAAPTSLPSRQMRLQ